MENFLSHFYCERKSTLKSQIMDYSKRGPVSFVRSGANTGLGVIPNVSNNLGRLGSHIELTASIR